MSGETVATLIGNLTADPELRYTPSGVPVANFTVASTPRYFDRGTNEWKDAEALFMRCSVWREAAENVAETLTRGSRVIVHGRLKQRSYETREGDKRTVVELEADEVGAALKFATAKVTRTRSTAYTTGTSVASDRSDQLVGAAAAGRGGQDPWGKANGWGEASAGAEPGF
ncbi:single-stranded DNA-binding protein [Nocardia sp. NPDC052566]|uniref:single-stranded DNA-binding protein n=1 Tax=Nocardia sp. NPDC052566 TaxID=3364330 RepID=UPI0037C7984E